MSTDLSKISYTEFKARTSKKLCDSILSLGEITDHFALGSPWREEIVTMILRLRDMQVENDE